MEEIIQQNLQSNKTPTLLLHSCCAPCSSSVLERLSDYFDITVFYYNPNIEPVEEYIIRLREQKRFLSIFPTAKPVKIIEGPYEAEAYEEITYGHEEDREGGKRCFLCYEFRLRKTAELAKSSGFDYFSTTLSVSPHKNAQKLNEIGERLSAKYGVDYLYSDFKKKDGYKRSIELSGEYGLYRQHYCGCRYSLLNLF
jgi:hypothetical protein